MVGSEYGGPDDPWAGAIEALLHGLTTDGAHHKQYWLEEAFRCLCADEYVDKAKAEFEWEDGTPS